MAFKYNEAANVSIRSVGGRWNIDEDGGALRAARFALSTMS